mmetsp:Transcript_54714/g.127652  ORF Transcript_54714/g.127652 Transcript_54714/m.127652 type:complete len:431 (-) Transcript_54714:173-1465(-)
MDDFLEKYEPDHPERRFSDAHERNRALAGEKESLQEWATRLWNRIDRDGNGYITSKELDCQEFHNIVRAAVAPVTGTSTGGATYARTQVNIDAAIQLCLRKADLNNDDNLSFREFRSLLRCLRRPRMARHTANLIFALFDLDGNGYIGRDEFHELFRFLLGRNPRTEDFEFEWDRLVAPAAGSANALEYVDQRTYIRWLQSSDDPKIRQQAPVCDPNQAAPAVSVPGSPSEFGTMTVDLSATFPRPSTVKSRPKWNQRFNCSINPGHVNDFRPAGMRLYFQREQSLPELRRFWEGHSGSTFRKHLDAFSSPPKTAPASKLFPKSLSTEGGCPMMLPERHSPGGSMRDLLTGEVVAWQDYWTPPARYRRPFHKQDRPLLPFETFGDVVDSSKIDSSPRTLRQQNRMLAARVKRRQKLAGPQRQCLLEAEPW